MHATLNSPCQELVPGISPKDLLDSRDEILATVRRAVETLLLADDQAKAAGFGVVWEDMAAIVNLCNYSQHKERVELGLTTFAEKLDTRGWERLLHASGLRTFMDTQARNQWDLAIKERDTPPLEPGAIEATFRAIHADRGLMVERGVLAVFRRLSWDYKTNEPCLFGRKIIVQRFLDYHGFINSGAGGLEDLIRALCIYDGKPEPDHRTGVSNCKQRGASSWSNEYLDLKWFKNGNAHATFKRQDLVDKLNAVLSRHYPGALPPPRGA